MEPGIWFESGSSKKKILVPVLKTRPSSNPVLRNWDGNWLLLLPPKWVSAQYLRANTRLKTLSASWIAIGANCGKRVMPSWENAMWREESSGKGQRERLQSRVNGEEWHSLKGLTLHRICMDHKHIKGLTLHRICMDHKHIKGLTSRRGHLHHFCLLLLHLGPTFANFCYEVSCHVKMAIKVCQVCCGSQVTTSSIQAHLQNSFYAWNLEYVYVFILAFAYQGKDIVFRFIIEL